MWENIEEWMKPENILRDMWLKISLVSIEEAMSFNRVENIPKK